MENQDQKTPHEDFVRAVAELLAPLMEKTPHENRQQVMREVIDRVTREMSEINDNKSEPAIKKGLLECQGKINYKNRVNQEM